MQLLLYLLNSLYFNPRVLSFFTLPILLPTPLRGSEQEAQWGLSSYYR